MTQKKNQMQNCGFCHLSEDDKKWLIFENNYWSVYLADKQDYIGRCIVVSRNHRESLSELDVNEWQDLKNMICSLESLFSKELGATMFNWSCLMNDAYKSSQSVPHVHFHVRPRYAEPIRISNAIFYDKEFSHHYNNHAEDQMDFETKAALFAELKQKTSVYFFNSMESVTM